MIVLLGLSDTLHADGPPQPNSGGPAARLACTCRFGFPRITPLCALSVMAHPFSKLHKSVLSGTFLYNTIS